MPGPPPCTTSLRSQTDTVCALSLVFVSVMESHGVMQGPNTSRSMLAGTSLSGCRLPLAPRRLMSGQHGRRCAIRTTAILDVAKTAFAQQNGAKVEARSPIEISNLPEEIRSKMTYDVGSNSTSPDIAYRATALSVRQRLINAFNRTQEYWR